MSPPKNIYKSQYKQDRLVNCLFFKNQKEGVFLDIGASDGVSLSNTYFFEKNKCWKGICVEPLPKIYDQLIKNRNCICIKGCISNYNGKAKLFSFGMLSFLIQNDSSKQLDRIEKESKAYSIPDNRIMEVECYKLNDILEQHNINEIDFCSLDIEGGELDILKSIDYNRYHIKVLTVENAENNRDILNFLKSKSFVFITSLGCDEIYAEASLANNISDMKRLELRCKHKLNLLSKKPKSIIRHILLRLKVNVYRV
jgi:FkbM family methyltransferase